MAYTSELKKQDPDNPVCVIKTSMGDIFVELFQKDAPETVKNFIGLAEGTKEFTDPVTNEMVKKPYYDGLIFHRVIKNFMIQTGCPLGNGTGGPGYSFKDEINADSLGLDKIKAVDENMNPHQFLMIRSQQQFSNTFIAPALKKLGIAINEEYQARMDEVKEIVQAITLKECYEKKGYRYTDSLRSHPPVKGAVAMANRGPDTNGSQFFINLVDTPWLAGKHTVFGRVIKGMEVVDKIGGIHVDAQNKPKEDVKILSIRLLDK